MTLPRIAIVGRPNVGKSSLMNRLARRRVSIVDPTPGVTRDRVSVVLELEPPIERPRGTESCFVELVDTGGYGVYTAEGRRYDDVGADLSTLTPEIETQIALALEQAQLILLVIDAQSGLTSLDTTIATLLRQRGLETVVVPVANKVDGESWIADGLDAASLGFGEPLCVSAKNGFGERKLLDTLFEHVADLPSQPEGEAEMKIAIVGRRNAGKSTLINALAGEPRVIVSEIAGTTRDAVDVLFEIDERRMLAIDTAGVRKRKSFADDVEHYAYDRMRQAIQRSDVVLFMVDATEVVSQVDKALSQELQLQFKPTVIVVNKWDLVDQERHTPESYLDYLTQQLRGLDYAPIVFVSAEQGEGLHDVVAMAFNLYQQAGHRVGTGELNRVVEDILQRRGPSSRLGTQAKLLYATQVSTHPPTLVLVVNEPKLFRGRYERYLLNRLREELPFSEVPIRVFFRKRKRVDLQTLKEGGGGLGSS
ncbi:MAG: ribosome biogenesis GTPase Der [Planctomycetota bacterium]|jgi:GTP-binding protein